MIFVLAFHGDYKGVKDKIAEGCDVNLASGLGYTALMNASCMNHIQIVELLLDNGADVNQKDKNGSTALMKACQYVNREIVILLLRAGAHINEISYSGHTAFMLAAIYDGIELFEILINAGALASIKNEENKTVFDYAPGTTVEYIKNLIYQRDQEFFLEFLSLVEVGANKTPDTPKAMAAKPKSPTGEARRRPKLFRRFWDKHLGAQIFKYYRDY